MQVLIYVGPAPSREQVLQFSAPIVRGAASALTLVVDGGDERQSLLDEAVARLAPPPHVPVTLRALPGNAQAAILAAAAEHPYDLAILGRLNQPIGRLLPGARSKVIAQRLQPSVLRVHGPSRPIRRILLASGGDHHTFTDVEVAGRLALPLSASVTILHVISQQSLLFERPVPRESAVEQFLAGPTPEARTLREAAARVERLGLTVQLKGRVGPVIDEILAELRIGGYDLLAIGAHQVASPLDRILLEDLTDDLLDLSALPVLVVKGRPSAGS